MLDVVVALLPAASVAVTVMPFAPSTRPLMVALQVVAVGYDTGPTVAAVFTPTVTVAPASTVPVIAWLFTFVGDVTALMATVGGAVSSVTLVVCVALLPAASVAVTVIPFAP